MKIKPFARLFLLASCLLANRGAATSVTTPTIEQPINLTAKSDPTRIPLGAVGVLCNYHYGLHHFIGEARPATDGAMRWPGGSELDQNLASVFGISVEPGDPTQITKHPVILRVKPWKAPAYSPYTKDQVLAATLWCLLRNAGGTPESPLDIRVITEDPEDKLLEARYSRKYVTRPAKEGDAIPSLEVPGTVIEEDARGIAWVVFPQIEKNEKFVPSIPGAIILKSGGDGDPGWHILPVWGNDGGKGDILRLNHWTSNICYTAFKPHGAGEANTYLEEGGANSFSAGSGIQTIFSPQVDQTTLAANLLALVVSQQPTKADPLTISISLDENELERFSAFANAEDWEKSADPRPHARKTILTCRFAWDPAAGKLTQGMIPLVELERKGWIVAKPVTETAAENQPGKED